MISPAETLSDSVGPLGLPTRRRFNGPVTTRRLRRTAMYYVALALVGFLPTVLGMSAHWRALGLGLVLPGGGFLGFGWWAVLGITVTLVLFVVSLVLWFGTGNVLAPIMTWLGAALLAAALADRSDPSAGAVPAIVAFIVVASIAGLVICRRVMAVRHAARVRSERSGYLPAELAALEVTLAPKAPATPRELDETQLAHIRHLLDLGLQPVDEFAGFDIIEQFQPSALRYQINHVQYALAQAQRFYTPNFHGYLSLAQEQVIEKLTVPEVWRYWRLERLWGRLSTNYDPVAFENIMLTGWSGICLNIYHANTGSTRFVDPGSMVFTLGNPKKTYRHDTRSFNASLLMNFERSPQTVYACEPNWTYSACNLYGINSVASHDAAFGTQHMATVAEPFLRGMRNELMTPAGDIIGFRSDYTGISVPAGGELMFFQAAGWVAPVAPLLARTLWAIARHEILRVDDGGPADYLAKPWMVDAGNYRNTGLFCRASILFAARELGDESVAEATLAAIEAHNQPVEANGARRFSLGSNYANALATQAMLTQPGDWTTLVTTRPPAEILTGPLLTHAEYHQVQVAQAISDGQDLRLVLRPAPEARTGEPARLGFARLRPDSAYGIDVNGERTSITSDGAGRAHLHVLLDDRMSIRLYPAA